MCHIALSGWDRTCVLACVMHVTHDAWLRAGKTHREEYHYTHAEKYLNCNVWKGFYKDYSWDVMLVFISSTKK